MSKLVQYSDLKAGDIVLIEVLDMRGGEALSSYKYLPFVVSGKGDDWIGLNFPSGEHFQDIRVYPNDQVTKLDSLDESGWWTRDSNAQA